MDWIGLDLRLRPEPFKLLIPRGEDSSACNTSVYRERGNLVFLWIKALCHLQIKIKARAEKSK